MSDRWIVAAVSLIASLVVLSGVRWHLDRQRGLPTGVGSAEHHVWSPEELTALESLGLQSLGPLPPDPTNRFADDPAAAELGHRLFFDTRMSAGGGIACATCHQPDRAFTDGLPKSQAIGRTARNAPTVIGSAYQTWYFWDGRADSAWAQALGPLESPVEHGLRRTDVARHVVATYPAEYEALFGNLPDMRDESRFPRGASPLGDQAERRRWLDMAEADRASVNRVFANVGKAIAAYERKLIPGPAPFDHYVQAALDADSEGMARSLTGEQAAGLRVFLGPGSCTQCHTGPLLSNGDFHNVSVPPLALGEQPTDIETVADLGVVRERAAGIPENLALDPGRAQGAFDVIDDAFNCLGGFSDSRDCAELKFIKQDPHSQGGAFKTPTLRNVAETAPYMHDGSFPTLRSVIEHYATRPAARVGHSELPEIEITDRQAEQLESFLATLSGGVAAEAKWLEPPPKP